MNFALASCTRLSSSDHRRQRECIEQECLSEVQEVLGFSFADFIVTVHGVIAIKSHRMCPCRHVIRDEPDFFELLDALVEIFRLGDISSKSFRGQVHSLSAEHGASFEPLCKMIVFGFNVALGYSCWSVSGRSRFDTFWVYIAHEKLACIAHVGVFLVGHWPNTSSGVRDFYDDCARARIAGHEDIEFCTAPCRHFSLSVRSKAGILSPTVRAGRLVISGSHFNVPQSKAKCLADSMTHGWMKNKGSDLSDVLI